MQKFILFRHDEKAMELPINIGNIIVKTIRITKDPYKQ
jgi:hypothetical protein